MANIIINPNSLNWSETPAEKTLRQKGHASKSQGVLETGFDFGGEETRKDNVGNVALQFMKAIYQLRQAMSQAGFDDEKCHVVVGIQVRNGFEKDGDGQWIETGSHLQIDKIAKKALEKK
jgi:hypothetical protein